MGTSIPRRENELRGTGQGEVKVYKMTPEEAAGIIGKPIPRDHSKPIELTRKSDRKGKSGEIREVTKGCSNTR